MEYFRNPWLDKEVKETLTEIIWWSSASVKKPHDNKYRREGQTVRVRKEKSLALQIVRFEQFDPEIRAFLSDTRRVIRATFTAAAVRAFILKNGRRLTEDTTSGLVALVDYEFTIRCDARERHRLTLLVHEVQFIGSVSGGTLGEPTHIEYAPGVEGLIADMSSLQTISPILGSQNEVRAREGSIHSQLSGNGSDGEQEDSTIVDGSEAGFATQVPKSRLSKSGRQSMNTVASPAEHNGVRRGGAPTIFTAGQISTQVKKKANYNNTNLISILNPKAGVKQQVKPTPALACTSTTNHPDVQAPRRSIIEPNDKSMRPMKQSLKAENTAASLSHSHGVPKKDLGPAFGVEQAIDLTEGRGVVVKPVHLNGTMETEDDACSNIIARKREAVNTAIHNPSTYVTSPIQAGSSGIYGATVAVNKELEEANVVKNALAEDVVNKAVPEQGAAVSTRTESELDPWAGMTGIPRRELRISKDQEELLNKKTCWLPPEPGERAPIANIPVPILNALTAKAESRARREREVAEAAMKHSEIGSTVVSSDPSDSDSDEPLSDWPPSPSPQRRFPSLHDMPPDSSPEQASQSTRKQRSRLNQKLSNFPTIAKPLEKRGKIPCDDEVSPPGPKRQRVDQGNKGVQDPVKESRSPSLNDDLSSPASTFAPIDHGTQASSEIRLSQRITSSSNVRVVQVERTEIDVDLGWLELPAFERLHTGVRDIAEETCIVPNTQHNIDGLDSDEECEIETSVLVPLEANPKFRQDSFSSSLVLPSTAPQPKKSVVQVKRTPYETSKTGFSRHNSFASRGSTGSPQHREGAELSSDPVIPCTYPNVGKQIEEPTPLRGKRRHQTMSHNNGDLDESFLASSPNADAAGQKLESNHSNRKLLPDFGFAEEAAFREGRDAKMEHRLHRREFYRKAMANRPPTEQTIQPGCNALANLSQLPPTTAAPLTYSIRSGSTNPPVQSAHRGPSVRSACSVLSGPSLPATPAKSLTIAPSASLAPAANPIVDWLINTSPTLSETESAADEEEQWYHDRNTPLKEFVRAYVQLKSVNGTMGKVDEKTGLVVPPKQNVDVLSWNDGYWLPKK